MPVGKFVSRRCDANLIAWESLTTIDGRPSCPVRGRRSRPLVSGEAVQEVMRRCKCSRRLRELPNACRRRVCADTRPGSSVPRGRAVCLRERAVVRLRHRRIAAKWARWSERGGLRCRWPCRYSTARRNSPPREPQSPLLQFRRRASYCRPCHSPPRLPRTGLRVQCLDR